MFSVVWMESSILLMILSSSVGGDSLQAATRDYDEKVFALLKHLKQNKLKLKSHTAPFMGHILTTDGLKPSAEISKAVLEMPQTQDKAATYLSKFCPNLSEIVHPLCVLTPVKQDFIWADQHTKAFNEAKQLVSTAPCLRYFDVCAPVVLQVDAPEYGLGATLLKPSTNLNASGDVQLQPVAYTYRTAIRPDLVRTEVAKHSFCYYKDCYYKDCNYEGTLSSPSFVYNVGHLGSVF